MDATQFKSLVLPLTGKLLHFANLMLRERNEAEDAVQEVCLKLWKIRDSLEKYDSIEAFAMKVTKNWCLDRLKARKPVYIDNYNSWYDRGSDDDPHKLMERSDRAKLLNRILDKLPEQQRLIIQLRELEGLEFEEIAVVMDMNINAIRVNLFRARHRIREELIKYEQNGHQSNKTSADKIL
jgi:RNA polymerase sigma-70 factor (ECF subfamily)